MLLTLLNPETSPLKSLKLLRVQLSPEIPHESLLVEQNQEVLIYPLIGHAATKIGKVPQGLFGTHRDSVLKPIQMVLRVHPGVKQEITFTLLERVFDALIVVADRDYMNASYDPYLQAGNIFVNNVGAGTTHERRVLEVIPPEGYIIQAGETLNAPGGWSSFPAHASPEVARQKYDKHQEVFFVVTPGEGHIFFDGYYCDGEPAQGIYTVRNNTALVTPLGSHPIVFSPGKWGWYFWAYVSTAITKTYNRYAHECGLKEYVE